MELPNKIHLELTVDELNTVLASLTDRPFRLVNDVILKINKQAQEQVDEFNRPTEEK